MKAEQTLRQTLGLKQQITVQMVQSLKVLQMSGQDLIAFVQETVLGNPLLEWDTSWKTRAQFEAVGTTPVNESITAQQEAGPRDVLRDHLLYAGLDAQSKRFAEIFISSLDDRGFLPEGKADWLDRFSCPPAVLDRILAALSDAAPGIGAQSMTGALLLQSAPEDEILRGMIAEDLALIASKDTETLADKYDVPVSEIEEKLDTLRGFHPYPFFQLGETIRVPAAPPDAILVWEDGWQIVLHDDVLPSITVDLHALDHLLGHSEADPFITEKICEAKQLLFSIQERNATLIGALHRVATRQEAYLRGLSDAPLPYLQKELADELALHPSTISRTVREKQLETPRGRISMDSCFARPLTAATPYTADLLLRELQILQKKFPAASDRVLTQKLNEAGVDVKRRTVNKYRRKLEGQ